MEAFERDRQLELQRLTESVRGRMLRESQQQQEPAGILSLEARRAVQHANAALAAMGHKRDNRSSFAVTESPAAAPIVPKADEAEADVRVFESLGLSRTGAEAAARGRERGCRW